VSVHLIIPGPPRGKGRPRTTRKGHVYTDAKTRAYEKRIRDLFREKYGADFTPLDGPLEMEIVVTFPVPVSASKKRRHDMLWGVECPTKRPDLSNLVKCPEDALNGLAYKDDAQIVSFAALKRYGGNGKVEVKIYPAGEEP